MKQRATFYNVLHFHVPRFDWHAYVYDGSFTTFSHSL